MEHLASRFGNPVTLDGLCVLGSFRPWKFVSLRQRPASIESYSAWPVSQPPVACDPGASGSFAASGAVGCRLQAARPAVKHPGFGLSPSPLWPVTLELLAALLLQGQWAAAYRPVAFGPNPRLSLFSKKCAAGRFSSHTGGLSAKSCFWKIQYWPAYTHGPIVINPTVLL